MKARGPFGWAKGTLPPSLGGTGQGSLDAVLTALIGGATARAPSLTDRIGARAGSDASGVSALLSTVLGLLLPGPCGRPTLTAGTPVQTATVSAGASVLWTPYNGNRILVWNGASWVVTTFAETTLTLNNPSHAANTLYDLFWAGDPSNAGTNVLGTGPGWTNSGAGTSARGTGAGTTELARIEGHLVNAVAITLRNGGTTYSIAANQATYLGTILTGASAGTIDFSVGGLAAGGTAARLSLFCANPASRAAYAVMVRDSTDSWTYATNTWRSSNNAATMRCTYACGLAEDAVSATFTQMVLNGAAQVAAIGIGLDVTNAPSGIFNYNGTANIYGNLTAHYSGVPGLGVHFLQAIELSPQALAVTFHGDNAFTYVQNGLAVQVRL